MPVALETEARRARGERVGWELWTGVLALLMGMAGGQWDLAWHRSIGRDTFWTPAHVTIYAGSLVIGLACVSLWRKTGSEAGVRVCGVRAPLGAWVAAWGGMTMLASAVFDNWWHRAYGLDVRIISPPHVVLLAGMRAVSLGVLLLLLAARDRVGGHARVTLRRLYLFAGGVTVASQMYFLEGYTLDVDLHAAHAYIAVCAALPVFLALLLYTSEARWTATCVTALYILFTCLEVWLFPLVPAEPRLGPVWFPVHHLVPTKFPLLLVAPAVAWDLLWPGVRRWKTMWAGVMLGALFCAVLVAVEWPFASFLLSHASEHWMFGTREFAYNARPDDANRLRIFVEYGGTFLHRALRWVEALAASMVSTMAGLWLGRWMREVRR